MKPEAKTLKELSQIYEIDIRTFKRWIEPHKNIIGDRLNKSKVFTPKQVTQIFELLGEPK
jgi:hypothetical protein